jgi:hypothetical protein
MHVSLLRLTSSCLKLLQPCSPARPRSWLPGSRSTCRHTSQLASCSVRLLWLLLICCEGGPHWQPTPSDDSSKLLSWLLANDISCKQCCCDRCGCCKSCGVPCLLLLLLPALCSCLMWLLSSSRVVSRGWPARLGSSASALSCTCTRWCVTLHSFTA